MIDEYEVSVSLNILQHTLFKFSFNVSMSKDSAELFTGLTRYNMINPNNNINGLLNILKNKKKIKG